MTFKDMRVADTLISGPGTESFLKRLSFAPLLPTITLNGTQRAAPRPPGQLPSL